MYVVTVQEERKSSMTRAEVYDILYSHCEIYRPPIEETSAFLEVTHGCSYRRCEFCDFCKDDFRVVPLKEVEYKSRLLQQVIGDKTSLHLLGCNPFCLSTDHLLQVLHFIRQNIPSITRVSMYARAEDVIKKSDTELRALVSAGLRDLHIGLESGCDEVLRMQKKGETVAQMMAALEMLRRNRIQYHLTLIPGLGGRKYSWPHAVETAAVLSNLVPASVWCMALKIWPDSGLAHMVQTGLFEPLSYREILMEEREMLSRTAFKKPCLYVDSTVLGKYTVMGILPTGKQTMLKQMDFLLNKEPEV